MFRSGSFRMKNSDLNVFEEAGLHIDLIVRPRDKFYDGSRP